MEKLRCQLHLWHPKYRRVTFKTRSIPLEPDFVAYLLEDGIRDDASTVSSSSSSSSSSHCAENQVEPRIVRDDGQSSSHASHNSRDEVRIRPSFSGLEAQVAEAISELNGAVFPKLNWSSPKDANWMMFDGRIRCESFDDIILLLKSSDYIVHDLCHAFDDFEEAEQQHAQDEVTYVLNLRRWHNLNPNSEFRCFWRHGDLNISQRHTSQFVEYLGDAAQRRVLFQLIKSFIEGLEDLDACVVIDVYVDLPPRRRVWLVDLAPWSESTDPLLFTWDELNEREQESPPSGSETTVTTTKEEFRVIESEAQCQQPLDRFNKVPQEVAEMTGYSHEELMKLVQNAEHQQQAASV